MLPALVPARLQIRFCRMCASQALTLFSEDDDYFMTVATCYMRLNRYDEALRMLQQVLDRSPKNYKALYQHAFCQRASGSQKDAIEGLTKVLKKMK